MSKMSAKIKGNHDKEDKEIIAPLRRQRITRHIWFTPSVLTQICLRQTSDMPIPLGESFKIDFRDMKKRQKCLSS